jgi:hypothetical protein
VGRPGLEPGTYGLKGLSVFDEFPEVAPAPHHFPTTLDREIDPAALAAELLEARQAGDPRWVELATELAAVARSDCSAPGRREFARLATELAEQVLDLAAKPAASRTRKRQ